MGGECYVYINGSQDVVPLVVAVISNLPNIRSQSEEPKCAKVTRSVCVSNISFKALLVVQKGRHETYYGAYEGNGMYTSFY